MRPTVWNRFFPDSIEVSKQRFMALFAIIGLACIAAALSSGNMMAFALILAVPLGIITLLSVVNSPMLMFFVVFVFNYLVMGVSRYYFVAGISVITVLSLVWTIYCVLEVVNPSAVFEAWLMARRLIYQGLIMAVIVSLLFTQFRQVRWLILAFSVLTLIAVAKILMQRFMGFDSYEIRWLIESESLKTHVIQGGSLIRYPSIFTDAGNCGSNMGCAGILFLLLPFYEKKLGLKIYYAVVGLLAMYAMFLSGTRGAMIVPLAGLAIYTILSKNFKAMAIGGVTLVGVYVFFAFTYIGEGNALIRRMRTAFRPTEDASFQVRMHNQAALREYLKDKPFGEGVGLGGVENRKYAYRVTTMIPHDSWYVKIWMETGIVGLILYVGTLVAVMLKCSHIVMYKIKDRELRGYIIAMLCGTFGLMVSAYGNAFLGQFPTMLLMFTFLSIAINGDKISVTTDK